MLLQKGHLALLGGPSPSVRSSEFQVMLLEQMTKN